MELLWGSGQKCSQPPGKGEGQGYVCALQLRLLFPLELPPVLGRYTRGHSALKVLLSLQGLEARQDLSSDTPGVEALCGADPPSRFPGVSTMSSDLPWHSHICYAAGIMQLKLEVFSAHFIGEPEKLFLNRIRQRLQGSVPYSFR